MSTNFDSSTPLAYTGLNTQVNPQTIAVNRAPTTNDWQSFYPGDLWRDTSVTPPVTYLLRSVAGNIGNWVALGGGVTYPITVPLGGTNNTSFTPFAPITGGTTATGTLQSADSGLANVGWVLTSTGASSLPTWQAGGSGGVSSITGDSGTVAGAIDLYANTGTANCGSSVSFTAASGTEIDLFLSDSNGNTLLGYACGNKTASGTYNTGIGAECFQALSSGSGNCAGGADSCGGVTTGIVNTAWGTNALASGNGSYNIALGYRVGINYEGTESSNIVISSAGVLGESNVIRVGTQGSGNGQQNSCYIAGIATVPTSNSQFVTIDTTTGQLGSTTVVPGAGITSINRKVVDYSMSPYSYTPTAGALFADIEIVGGGGGGGGAAAATGQLSNGGGGGAGGYSKYLFVSPTAQTVTIGAKGAGGVGVLGNGGDGGSTTFGSILTATGGLGGLGSNLATGNETYGGYGGAGSGGNVNLNGDAGGDGFGFYATSSNYFVLSGTGGSSFYGSGGTNNASNGTISSITTNGENAFVYGSGGSGGLTANSSTPANGGTGSDGVCIITEYIS